MPAVAGKGFNQMNNFFKPIDPFKADLNPKGCDSYSMGYGYNDGPRNGGGGGGGYGGGGGGGGYGGGGGGGRQDDFPDNVPEANEEFDRGPPEEERSPPGEAPPIVISPEDTVKVNS